MGVVTVWFWCEDWVDAARDVEAGEVVVEVGVVVVEAGVVDVEAGIVDVEAGVVDVEVGVVDVGELECSVGTEGVVVVSMVVGCAREQLYRLLTMYVVALK